MAGKRNTGVTSRRAAYAASKVLRSPRSRSAYNNILGRRHD